MTPKILLQFCAKRVRRTGGHKDCDTQRDHFTGTAEGKTRENHSKVLQNQVKKEKKKKKRGVERLLGGS